MLIESLEMSYAEAVDALAPRAGDFKPEALSSLYLIFCSLSLP